MAKGTRAWRQIIDWGNLQDIDDDIVSVCLTKREATALLGLTPYLGWSSRWKNLGTTTPEDLKDFQFAIEHRLLTMSCTKFRTDPANDCIIQISYDEGDTWATLWDASLCMIETMQPMMDAQNQQLLKDLVDLYETEGVPGWEKLIYDGSDDDEFRDYALCNALQVLLQGLVDSEIARRARVGLWWDDVTEAMTIAAGLIALIPIPGAVFLAAATAFAAAFIKKAAPIWEAINIAVLQDADAVEEVACSMYNDMKGVTPTFSSFKTSLDNPDYSPISNAAIIGNAMHPLIQELESFVAFLELWQNLYGYAEGGFLDSCVCPEEEWTVQFGDTLGAPPSYSILSNPPLSDGIWNNPNKWFYAEDLLSLSYSDNAVTVEFPASIDIHVSWVSMRIDIVNPDGGSNPTGQFCKLYDEFDAELFDGTSSGWHKGNTPGTVVFEPEESDVRKIRLTARCYEPLDNKNTTTYLLKIQVHGTGTIPPEWSAFEV